MYESDSESKERQGIDIVESILKKQKEKQEKDKLIATEKEEEHSKKELFLECELEKFQKLVAELKIVCI